MLFPVGSPYIRMVLWFLAVSIFAALGGLATLTTGASLWFGLGAAAVVGAFFRLLLSGLCPRLVTAASGPEECV